MSEPLISGDMETVVFYMFVGLYLLIGLVKASKRISSGVYGTKGPLPTFVFVVVFWPLFRSKV